METVFHSYRCQYGGASVHREAGTNLQDMRKTVVGFLGTYYEDHIQPVKDSYVEWASGVRRAMRNKIRTTADNYVPKLAIVLEQR